VTDNTNAGAGWLIGAGVHSDGGTVAAEPSIGNADEMQIDALRVESGVMRPCHAFI